MLLLTDVVLLVDSALLFAVIGKIVSSMSYDAQSNEVKVSHFNNWGLKPQQSKFKPEQMVKHKRKSLNPFIGYKVLDIDQMLATEAMKATWHDRQLLDSMISKVQMKKPKSQKEIKKRKDLLED